MLEVSFGGNADMATFSGAAGAASIYGGTGADTLDFNADIGAATIDLGVVLLILTAGALTEPPLLVEPVLKPLVVR